MSIAANIYQKVNQLPEGVVFTYKDVLTDPGNSEAVIKSLNRMVAKGKLEKLARGKFYRPEISVFGELKPSMYEVLKDLMVKDGKRVGYFTGTSVQNELGLTTQLSKIIEIGRNDRRPPLKRGFYEVVFVKQNNPITETTIPLLQILDAFRKMKEIPDTSREELVLRLKWLVAECDENTQVRLVELSKKYPPGTRALLGAILEELGNRELSLILRDTLNPVSTYNTPGVKKALSNAQKWNFR